MNKRELTIYHSIYAIYWSHKGWFYLHLSTLLNLFGQRYYQITYYLIAWTLNEQSLQSLWICIRSTEYQESNVNPFYYFWFRLAIYIFFRPTSNCLIKFWYFNVSLSQQTNCKTIFKTNLLKEVPLPHFLPWHREYHDLAQIASSDNFSHR